MSKSDDDRISFACSRQPGMPASRPVCAKCLQDGRPELSKSASAAAPIAAGSPKRKRFPPALGGVQTDTEGLGTQSWRYRARGLHLSKPRYSQTDDRQPRIRNTACQFSAREERHCSESSQISLQFNKSAETRNDKRFEDLLRSPRRSSLPGVGPAGRGTKAPVDCQQSECVRAHSDYHNRYGLINGGRAALDLQPQLR